MEIRGECNQATLYDTCIKWSDNKNSVSMKSFIEIRLFNVGCRKIMNKFVTWDCEQLRGELGLVRPLKRWERQGRWLSVCRSETWVCSLNPPLRRKRNNSQELSSFWPLHSCSHTAACMHTHTHVHTHIHTKSKHGFSKLVSFLMILQSQAWNITEGLLK